MSKELVPVESPNFIDACKQQYAGMTQEQLLEEAKLLYMRGLENALRLAAVVWAVNERGFDMAPFRKIIGSVAWVYLEIANGRLLIDSLRKWGRESNYLNVLKRLTPSDQLRLCHGPISVFERAADGTPTHRQLELDEIVESGLAAQVFEKNTIRSVVEQEAWIKREERRRKKTPKWETFGAFEMNDEAEEAEPMSRRPLSFTEIEALYKECKRRGWGKKR